MAIPPHTDPSATTDEPVTYVENLSREELTGFVRHYLLRSRILLARIIVFVVVTGLGLGALFSGDAFLLGAFVVMVVFMMLILIWLTVIDFRQFKVYNQTQYPQRFEFSAAGIHVSNANGVRVEIPWRHVRQIYTRKQYTFLATIVGTYWVNKDRFGDHLKQIRTLWQDAKARKSA